jgi:hypothetical protein
MLGTATCAASLSLAVAAIQRPLGAALYPCPACCDHGFELEGAGFLNGSAAGGVASWAKDGDYTLVITNGSAGERVEFNAGLLTQGVHRSIPAGGSTQDPLAPPSGGAGHPRSPDSLCH